MSTAHSNAAKEFLKNQTYAKWHDATFWSVRTKRDKMAYGLEEWEQLREKASQIKRHTIRSPILTSISTSSLRMQRRMDVSSIGPRMQRSSTRSSTAS